MKVIILFFITLSITTSCYAHGFAKYVSTPITPPIEFVWWFPVSILILLCSLILLIHKIISVGWKKSIFLSFISIILFTVTFYLFGTFASSTSTAPPPGLGMPCPVFWGFGWKQVGLLFLRWNVYGMIFLLFWVFLFTKARKHKRRIIFACSILSAYIICLLPYICTGAIVHGWSGYYVQLGCDMRLEILTESTIKYLDSHDKKFPDANSFDELMNILAPYIEYNHFLYRNVPLEVCPLGSAYEKTPKKYEWNKKYSGKSINDFSYENLDDNEFLFKCPYHQHPSTKAYFRLLEYIESND